MEFKIHERIPIAEELWWVLEQDPIHNNLPLEARIRQLEVLNRLPFDWELKLNGEFQHRIRKYTVNEHRNIFIGELFEWLAKSDPQIVKPQQNRISDLILAAMQEPSRFLLDRHEIKHSSCPDAIFLEDSGIITEVLEAKFGRISYDSYMQILQFKVHLNSFIGRLSTPRSAELQEGGLGELIPIRHRLGISSDFKTTLVVPSNFYSKNNVDTIIYNPSNWADNDLNKARAILKNCNIVSSPFSRGEVLTIYDYLRKKHRNS